LGHRSFDFGISQERAEFEFDCTHGSIDSPFMLESDGSFKLNGTYTRETHGPIRVGHPLQSRQAEYFGHVDGNKHEPLGKIDRW